jgi:hypothetical protein
MPASLWTGSNPRGARRDLFCLTGEESRFVVQPTTDTILASSLVSSQYPSFSDSYLSAARAQSRPETIANRTPHRHAAMSRLQGHRKSQSTSALAVMAGAGGSVEGLSPFYSTSSSSYHRQHLDDGRVGRIAPSDRTRKGTEDERDRQRQNPKERTSRGATSTSTSTSAGSGLDAVEEMEGRQVGMDRTGSGSSHEGETGAVSRGRGRDGDRSAVRTLDMGRAAARGSSSRTRESGEEVRTWLAEVSLGRSLHEQSAQAEPAENRFRLPKPALVEQLCLRCVVSRHVILMLTLQVMSLRSSSRRRLSALRSLEKTLLRCCLGSTDSVAAGSAGLTCFGLADFLDMARKSTFLPHLTNP